MANRKQKLAKQISRETSKARQELKKKQRNKQEVHYGL